MEMWYFLPPTTSIVYYQAKAFFIEFFFTGKLSSYQKKMTCQRLMGKLQVSYISDVFFWHDEQVSGSLRFDVFYDEK